MLGISVHGLLGVDADLQRSAFAAHVVQQQNTVEYHSVICRLRITGSRRPAIRPTSSTVMVKAQVRVRDPGGAYWLQSP